MAAVSMHSTENAFGGMNRRLSPAFRSVVSPLQERHFDLEKLRELARSDEFSDSESDGVSDNDEEVNDVADTLLVPFCRASPKQTTLAAQRCRLMKHQKKSNEKGGGSPKGDEWEIVDKSPTFESVADGKTELGGESWFVHDREH